jgi:prepilin peptidase CpaA
MPWPVPLVAAATAILLAAACLDVVTLTIPNRIPVLLGLLFIVAVPASGIGWWSFAHSHLLAGALVLVSGMALFAMGLVGGGDVKLLAAVSVGLGLPALASGLLAVSIAGMLLSLALIGLRRTGLSASLKARGWPLLALEPGKGVPYGVAIAAGFVWVGFGAG